jgi:hypothetical protein
MQSTRPDWSKWFTNINILRKLRIVGLKPIIRRSLYDLRIIGSFLEHEYRADGEVRAYLGALFFIVYVVYSGRKIVSITMALRFGGFFRERRRIITVAVYRFFQLV